MRKVLIITSALAVLGVGSAAAQNFRPSNPNSGPDAFQAQTVTPVDQRIVTSSIGTTAGFSAAQGFGPSNESNLPAPRFQNAR